MTYEQDQADLARDERLESARTRPFNYRRGGRRPSRVHPSGCVYTYPRRTCGAADADISWWVVDDEGRRRMFEPAALVDFVPPVSRRVAWPFTAAPRFLHRLADLTWTDWPPSRRSRHPTDGRDCASRPRRPAGPVVSRIPGARFAQPGETNRARSRPRGARRGATRNGSRFSGREAGAATRAGWARSPGAAPDLG